MKDKEFKSYYEILEIIDVTYYLEQHGIIDLKESTIIPAINLNIDGIEQEKTENPATKIDPSHRQQHSYSSSFDTSTINSEAYKQSIISVNNRIQLVKTEITKNKANIMMLHLKNGDIYEFNKAAKSLSLYANDPLYHTKILKHFGNCIIV